MSCTTFFCIHIWGVHNMRPWPQAEICLQWFTAIHIVLCCHRNSIGDGSSVQEPASGPSSVQPGTRQWDQCNVFQCLHPMVSIPQWRLVFLIKHTKLMWFNLLPFMFLSRFSFPCHLKQALYTILQPVNAWNKGKALRHLLWPSVWAISSAGRYRNIFPVPKATHAREYWAFLLLWWPELEHQCSLYEFGS